MKTRLVVAAALILGFLGTCRCALAHHGSRAYYDMTKTLTMTGTVTDVAWQNPHVYLLFDVKDDQGHVVHWGAETYSPIYLERNNGWNRNTLKPGEQITITLWQSKTGAPRGYLSKVVADGKLYVITTQ